ncbi:MAG: hypothetical protein LQ345_003297 [Seirophora villosa]|nr:MAG: hypothetical protein LQ345_003297 [Seirophora villosa]
MGEPTYTSDYMWNDLMDYQGLRLEKEEGERLNISAAPLPNGGYATMFDHCLEAVRTSIMCHPDLTPHPLRWAKSLPNHPLVANPNVERECVDWDYLHEFVKTRKYHLPQVLEGMRETGQKMPGSES